VVQQRAKKVTIPVFSLDDDDEEEKKEAPPKRTVGKLPKKTDNGDDGGDDFKNKLAAMFAAGPRP
jgi:hypothetical protein